MRTSRSVLMTENMTLHVGDTLFSRTNTKANMYRLDEITVDRDLKLTCWTFGDNPCRKTGNDRFIVHREDVDRVLTNDIHLAAWFHHNMDK